MQLWSPAAVHGNWGLILQLEGVQRRFTRLINGIGTLPYSERLEALNLTTLAERRLRGDLIETFKIVNNLVDYGKNLFKMSRTGRNIICRTTYTRNTGVKNLLNSFLTKRVLNYWNRLPSKVKCAQDVESFKICLQKYKRENILVDHVGHFREISTEV